MFKFLSDNKTAMISRADALPGRDTAIDPGTTHVVLGTPLQGPWPEGHQILYLAMGCFWGAERIFWEIDGVYSTAVGYMGGWTKNPTYEETCTAQTGHTEAVQVIYDPSKVDVPVLMKAFWENHDPTTPHRQGNDVGTQYRSAVYTTTDAQMVAVEASTEKYQTALTSAGFGEIATEIKSSGQAGDGTFYFAEDYHQGYLHKNPRGYCNHGYCQVGYDLEAHGQTGSGPPA